MDTLDYSLDLLRRLAPSKVQENCHKILNLRPDLAESLLSTVDVHLETKDCLETGKPFLACEYNRDGDSFRYHSLTKFSLF